MNKKPVRRHFDVRWVAERGPVSTSAVERDWFADEVAVDFPSVAGVVERIRETFFGREDRETLQAELRLSAREARNGVVVPLTVPVRRTCEPCGGRGETWTEPCPTCCGTGHTLDQHRVRVTVPAGVGDGDRFRFRLFTPLAPVTRVEVRVSIQ